MSFRDIKHQSSVIDFLERALEKNRLPHALLFQGPANAGQRETARELAKAMFCENKSGLDSCGVCVHCRQVDRNTHPDFVALAPGEDSQVIKVDEIRDLISKANLKPFQASAKLFLIEEADAMNDIAQNALLKTLEEPAGKTVFVLISSHPEKLLTTIHSRVQALHFFPPHENETMDTELKAFAAAVVEFVLNEGRSKAPDLSKLDRDAIGKILDQAILYFRELFVFRVGAGQILDADPSSGQRKRQAENFDEEALIEIIETIAGFKEKIAAMVNTKLALSVLWDSLGKKAHAE